MKRKTLAYIVLYSILPIVDIAACLISGEKWYIGLCVGLVMDIAATLLFLLAVWILLNILD